MKERPILFSGPMVRAILAGAKTQTRRVIKPQPKAVDPAVWYADAYNKTDEWCFWGRDGTPDHNKVGADIGRCPFGVPGDRLWVRETHHIYAIGGDIPQKQECVYRADPESETYDSTRWTPSIFMPRKWSRITLEVTGVSVERLHEISEDDACAEGISPESAASYAASTNRPYGFAYRELWMDINEKRAPWDSNPFVWVVEFGRAMI